MHLRDSASGGPAARAPNDSKPWRRTSMGWRSGLPRTRFHRLRTALKSRTQLRLPQLLFFVLLGGCKYRTKLRSETTSDTVTPTEVQQRPRTQCRKQGRFYLLEKAVLLFND